MNDEINYRNNPLHSVGLKKMLVELTDHYGFEILLAYLNINCFRNNPSVASSVKFLKKTDWAREKVEAFYLYTYKNLPKVSHDQYALSPRDRIIPDDQVPGEPAELSLEDAQRLREERERKAAEFDSKSGSAKNQSTDENSRRASSRTNKDTSKDNRKSSSTSSSESTRPDLNPWGNPWT